MISSLLHSQAKESIALSLRYACSGLISEFCEKTKIFRNKTTGLRILMYHAVGTPAYSDSMGLYSISENVFKEQMLEVSQSDTIHTVSLNTDTLKETSNRLAISFDDGYMDNLKIAAPIMVELGIPFTVFVTADFVRKLTPGFLTPDALVELSHMPGVDIGAHGVTHCRMSDCNTASLREEMRLSKSYLEDLLGREITSMAYPNGACDRRVMYAALEAGYRLAACSYPGVNTSHRNPMLLKRTEITANDDISRFRQKLSGCWDWQQWIRKDPDKLSSQ